MLKSSSLVAFVSTTDLDRARRFYEATLGLELVEQGPVACVFDANGTMLRVTLTDRAATPGYTVLGWRVDDMDRIVGLLASGGVTFNRYASMDQDSAGVWTTPGGDRVAWFSDPDGNTLSDSVRLGRKTIGHAAVSSVDRVECRTPSVLRVDEPSQNCVLNTATSGYSSNAP